jgi:hypothetical protein
MQRTSGAKKCKRVGKGDVLPLDRSLLMGVPPYVDAPYAEVAGMLAYTGLYAAALPSIVSAFFVYRSIFRQNLWP